MKIKQVRYFSWHVNMLPWHTNITFIIGINLRILP